MKFIVTNNFTKNTQTAKPIEHNNPILIPGINEHPQLVENGLPGQIFVLNSKYKLVPENTNEQNTYKALCVGADVIPTGSTCKKHLVLFFTEFGDVHYEMEANDVFFPTQTGHELMVRFTGELDLNKPNKGFTIIKNITTDAMRSNFIKENKQR